MGDGGGRREIFLALTVCIRNTVMGDGGGETGDFPGSYCMYKKYCDWGTGGGETGDFPGSYCMYYEIL